MGPRASLDGRKISSQPGFDPGRVKYYMGIYHTSEIVCVDVWRLIVLSKILKGGQNEWYILW